VRLADFGSAVDAEVTVPGVGMYPERGPSVAEETEGYQPPEAALGGEAYAASRPSSYDLWSMGIVILELILGSPHVMPLSKRAEAVLRLRYAEQPEAVMRRLLAANALAEHCILPLAAAADPAAMARYRGHNGAPCGKEAFVEHVLASDPLRDSGRHGGALRTAPRLLELLDLAWELLRWRPEDRMSAEHALRHPSVSERHVERAVVGAEAETGQHAVVGTERLLERAVVGAGVDTRRDWKQALLEITPLLSAPSAAAAAA
jgi:serine/threonine protein kinase